MKKILLALMMVLCCGLIIIAVCPAQSLDLNPEEELQLAKEPPITAAELDLFIKTAPRFIESVNDAETLAIANEIGWSKVRMAAIGSKIVMAHTSLNDPEIYAFLVEAELFGRDFVPSDEEIALVKARMDELDVIFAESAEVDSD